jgi:transcriptional regulator with XRE-family HTH domain
MDWGKVIADYNPGKSQYEIAARYKLGQSQISLIVRGAQQPGFGTLAKIAKVHRLKIWQLVKKAEEAANATIEAA